MGIPESVMDELSLPAKIIDGLLAIMAAIVLWFTKRSVKQYDDRIEILERDAVRIASLNLFREQLAKEHQENRGRLERIEDRVDSILDEMIRK